MADFGKVAYGLSQQKADKTDVNAKLLSLTSSLATPFNNLAYQTDAYLKPTYSGTNATTISSMTNFVTYKAGKYLVFADFNFSITNFYNGTFIPMLFDGTTVYHSGSTVNTPSYLPSTDKTRFVTYGIVTLTSDKSCRAGVYTSSMSTSITNNFTMTPNKVYVIPMNELDNDVVSAMKVYDSALQNVPVIKPNTPPLGSSIMCFGDSMTGSTTTWVYTLNNTYGVNTTNRGIGGQTAGQIATRQGGLSLIADPFTIPADTSQVPITLNQAFYANQSAYEGINPVYINGIKGTLYNTTNTLGGFTFARSEAGTAVTLTRPTVVFTDNMRNYRKNPMIIWIGTNGDYSTSSRTSDNLIEIIDRMLSYGECQKYLIIGLTTDVNQGIPDINTALAKKYGRRFLDLRSYMIQYGLSDMGYTATADDTTRIAANNVPSSLLSDGTHFKPEVQVQVTTPLVYKKLQELYMV